ncbi:MAG: type II toxin-antitoxin system HipA family toxin [Bacteroidia bacterium]
MITIAKVNLWKTLVGAVLWDKQKGVATFEFDATFSKKDWDVSPVTMPLKEIKNGQRIFSFPLLNKETYKGLPGLLADSLPDKFGNNLLDAWLARQGRDPDSVNPVERLCYTGKRGMGAIEFEPATHSIDDNNEQIEIKALVRLAREVLEEKKKLRTNIKAKPDKALSNIISVGTSAGGARAKAIIAYNEKTGEVRSGHIDNLTDFEYWIIKFDGVTNRQLGDPKGYGKIEYAYYKMALDCGINMTTCKLLNENNRSHFMTKRFDRIGNTKLHMQTLCAIAHYDYNNATAYSYEQAFQIMRQLKLPYSDFEQLYMRMIFNVIARNQDDHTKNISFLMNEESKWKLSPAYDVTYAYDPKNKWMKAHQLSINGKNDDIKKADVLSVAKEMNIKKPLSIIESVNQSVKKWRRFAKEATVNTDQIKAIGKTFNYL